MSNPAKLLILFAQISFICGQACKMYLPTVLFLNPMNISKLGLSTTVKNVKFNKKQQFQVVARVTGYCSNQKKIFQKFAKGSYIKHAKGDLQNCNHNNEYNSMKLGQFHDF
jgi:hypothetical protein